MSDDDTRYRVTRRTRPPPNRNTLRDVVMPTDLAAPRDAAPATLPPTTPSTGVFAAGSRAGIPRVPVPPPPPLAHGSDPEIDLEIAEPQLLEERRMFGGHEVVVQHRGDEVTFILPGAVRLVGNRNEALDLVRAFLARPDERRR